MTPRELWERYKALLFEDPGLGMALDLSRAGLGDGDVAEREAAVQAALGAMAALEGGAIANPDEGRRVGHYWLRAPEKAPEPELGAAIRDTWERVLDFAARVHDGRVSPPRADRFRHVLVIGIGGSALGPQLVADALGGPGDRLAAHFLDNTDPDGLDRVLGGLGDGLAETLAVVISKSGGTAETRNGMVEAEAAYRSRGLEFAAHAVAITQDGSALDRQARAQGFLARFPMWDWVGGRTSVTSAVGLLPAALQGIDIDAVLAGAGAMDGATREQNMLANPAALIALMWHHAGKGKGLRDMVILPYKDRLLLLSRYLQQLVMESLGKEKDLAGNVVHQGIAVYGNKGSTDQHAFVQQLRDGLDNFFVTFIEVQEDRPGGGKSLEVEPGRTSGDYLAGFLRGTREALSEGGRESMTITLRRFDAAGLGKLIALFERAVGLYARLIGINAYHQPGVQAGKLAAEEVLALQAKVLEGLRAKAGEMRTVEAIAKAIGEEDRAEMVFHLLERMSANHADKGVVREAAENPFKSTYGVSA
jgi:glucose-6-phosphate isomerase